MNHKKSAFSFIEMTVIFIFIGLIALMQLRTMKTNINKYGPSYTSAYTTLKKAAYNVLADIHCPDPNSANSECRTGPRSFPKTSQELCERLSEFISPVGNTTCDAKSISKLADNFVWEKTKPDGSEDSNYSLKFTATNGTKYYISDMIKSTDTGGVKIKNPDNDDDESNYFIVYIDINGDGNPNRVDMQPNDQVFPDIVPFAVTTRGEVVPVGYPTLTKEYLTAKIKLPDKGINQEFQDDLYSKEMTFSEAVINAWGQASDPNSSKNNEDVNIPFSIDYTKRLNLNSKARNFYTYETTTDPKDAQAPMNGCVAHDFTCRAIINEYMK